MPLGQRVSLAQEKGSGVALDEQTVCVYGTPRKQVSIIFSSQFYTHIFSDLIAPLLLEY